MTNRNLIFTIGHSNHELEDFLKILDDQGIDLLVDVRTAPYSKYSPHFNKKRLKTNLEESGREYVYLGNKIGGRPADERYYHEGRVLYSLLEKDEKYLEGIVILTELVRDKKVVLMCSEEDPLRCHRHQLLTQTLLKKGYHIVHIRGNGEIQEVKDKSVQTTLFS
jgi:uncharacterized protein (DUF488 family)